MAEINHEQYFYDHAFDDTAEKSYQNQQAFTGGGLIKGTIVHEESAVNIASLADGAGATASITVNGVALGDTVIGVSFEVDLQDITVTAYVQSANTVEVRVQNESGGVIDLDPTTVRLVILDLT